ncbi:MAG: cytochrome c biogenesis protein CcdA [Actinobacteria bacterium]|nr:cytochrome c biogenesis protein CcdA [Actinomycetota bacterium]MCL5882666.1 cytochrome c biogenesis protein CcdA [Actinomycetota bacterium]
MEITEVTFLAFVWAFIAGLASFLSPCVLPLLPGYLSYVSGVGVDQLGANVRKVAIASVAFVIGFVVFFSLQGAAAGLAGSELGSFLSFFTGNGSEGKRFLEILAGIFLIGFGIFALGIFNPLWLQKERRLRMLSKPAGLLGILGAGMVFSVGIGPCTGPLLGSIYMLAIGTQDPAAGASLLFVYALGMGLPFVLSGFLFAKAIGTFSFVKNHFGAIKIASGSLLILFGVLLATGQIEVMTEWMQRWLPSVNV